MHWAAVRVDEASSNARHVLFGKFLSARCDRTSQGDLKLARVLARPPWDMRLSGSNIPVGETIGARESDNLRARGKTATLHCSHFGPMCPDM